MRPEIGPWKSRFYMNWVAPSEKDTTNGSLERILWDSADQFRANSGLKAQEYSGPILGIIFLRFAEVRFAKQRAKLEKSASSSRRGSRLPVCRAFTRRQFISKSAAPSSNTFTRATANAIRVFTPRRGESPLCKPDED